VEAGLVNKIILSVEAGLLY